MFNEEQTIFRIKGENSSNKEPITLPEPNRTKPFEKGIEPKE